MLDTRRSFSRLLWMGRIAVVPVFAAVFIFAQSAVSPSAHTAPATESGADLCPNLAGTIIPFNATIQAKLQGTLDSAHLKVGKEIWVTVSNNLVFPGCTLNEGSVLYGHIKAVGQGKDTNSSELSVAFDYADCAGHPKKEMPLWLIALVAPAERLERLHEELPIEMKAGAKRNIRDVAAKEAFSDDILNPGGKPQTVRAGVVAELPKIKLEVTGGPGCSARITSTDNSVLLPRNAELILLVQSKI
ncbi:MAG: hypothetical protein ACLPXT_14040 [Terracidiphilus sp.]